MSKRHSLRICNRVFLVRSHCWYDTCQVPFLDGLFIGGRNGSFIIMLNAVISDPSRKQTSSTTKKIAFFCFAHEIYRHRTSLYLSLIGIILRWVFLIWELIFIYCGLFFPHLGSLWKAVITGDTVTRLSIPIRGRGKSPEEGQRWNLAET